jgi:guanylate kinase
MSGMLIVVSGPSGVGKGTVCKRLIERFPMIKLSISATTRSPRPGEVQGKNYFFHTEEEFQEKIKASGFLEWATVYGNMYGTPKPFVMEELKKGEIVLLEIDIQGAIQVQNTFREGVFVFLLPPNMEELRSRICGRGGESKESIKTRLGSAKEEILRMKDYDYAVVNDTVDNAVDNIWSIIKTEKMKVYRVYQKYIRELEEFL